jgi:predicted DNA-binding transcriptional regulator AlpA
MGTQTCTNVAELEPLVVDARTLGTLLGVSRATIFAMHARGALPRPVRPTRRAPRWRVDEIRAWLAAGCPPRETWETVQAARR